MPDRRNKAWILFFFCCSNVLITFNTTSLTAAIPQISRSLNVSAVDAGGIIAYYLIPYGLCALVYPPLASKFSSKALMFMTTALYSVSCWMCLWGDGLNTIVWGRILGGFAASAVVPLGLITLGRIFEKEVRGRVLGLFFSASFFGAMLGLAVNMFMDWHWQFILPAVAGGFLALGYLACPKKGMEAQRHVKVNYWDAFRLGGLRRILMLIFAMSFLFHGVSKWYGVYLDKMYAYDQRTISLLLILTAIISTAGQNIGGYVTDKCGRAASCYFGIIVLGLAIMLLYGHYPYAGLAVVLSLISLGWTIAHNGISTVLTDLSATYRSELAALNSSVRFFSGGIGFWLSGTFVQNNFGLTFLGIGILMLSVLPFVEKVIPKRKDV